ncbi:MAG: helix-turn-helix domain-containing protein [Oscillospiraceae bacterium]
MDVPYKQSEKDFYSELGRRISELRKSRKMTQHDLSEKLGIRQETVSMIEQGKRKPSIFMVRKIANLFDVDYDLLLGKPEHNRKTAVKNQPDAGTDMLFSMCKNADIDELNKAASVYHNLWIYCMIRMIYETNPYNTDMLFKVSKDDFKKVMDIVNQAPVKLSAYLNASSENKSSIEPPLEKAAQFREFISICEGYISHII